MFDTSLYLRAAEDLRGNRGQWDAYNSEGHCVVIAGPGSGKTKTLTIKLTRMLAEDVEEPRGLACITYNNECARELETRLDGLGVRPGGRVFVGTVHSFSLTNIILPYFKTVDLGLSHDFAIATQQQQGVALEQAFKRTIGGPRNPAELLFPMNIYRRSHMDRDTEEWRSTNEQLAHLSEAYEGELRGLGLIDFEDMPLIAVRALRDHPWIQRAILAKFPIIAVDEYQDLGVALHRMVMGLCFSAGVRLFAVGDVDQSIYGFNGANPQLLDRLSKRPDVERVNLQLNYRSGSRIIAAAEHALGEARGYRAIDGSPEGSVFFHPMDGDFNHHAERLCSNTLPEIGKRLAKLRLGEIAVLYPAAWIGDHVATAATVHDLGFVRTDTNAIYPRHSRIMRWLELCAMWSVVGWRRGSPRLAQVVSEGRRIFSEAIRSPDDEDVFQRQVLTFMWSRRDPACGLNQWLLEFTQEVLRPLLDQCGSLADEEGIVRAFAKRTAVDGDNSKMTLGLFAGIGEGGDRLVLSTFHSAKGREFRAVVLFGIDEGRMPRNNIGADQLLEARRLFYVGLTRAKSEVHIMYSKSNPSRFVREVRARL